MRFGTGGKGSELAEAVAHGPLPSLGSTVRLRLSAPADSAGEDLWVELPVHVVDVPAPRAEQRQTVVIEPPDLRFLPWRPDHGVEHYLVWTRRAGVLELPVRLPATGEAAQSGGATVPDGGEHWRLTATGPAQPVQRRQFVRVSISLPANVRVLGVDDATLHTVAGQITDLCEGGAGCILRGEAPPPGTHVVLVFTDDTGSALDCRGMIVRHDGGDCPGGRTLAKGGESRSAVAIRFDDPEEHGDIIRRMVFAEQLRLRHLLNN